MSRTTSGANGLVRKSKAPSFMASTAVSTVPKAVMIMVTASGSKAETWRSTSTPSMPSILRSVTTKSTSPRARSVASPAPPDGATSAVCPILRMVWARPSRMVSLSSMIRMTPMCPLAA